MKAIPLAIWLLFTLGVLAGIAAAQAPGYVPPAGANVPKVGDKAPDFTLPDTAGKSAKLSEFLATPIKSNAPAKNGSWVLLIFYRGYW